MDDLKMSKETVWLNPDLQSFAPGSSVNGYSYAYMKAAQNRFVRFMPYIAKVFPETAGRKGIIESELVPLTGYEEKCRRLGTPVRGRIFLKDDARLPVAGSVKARGGIHEVLKIAESLAQKAGLLMPTDNYAVLDTEEFRRFFGEYTIRVGSTGNLGISIGRTAARIGFRAVVYMSSDAKQWKKDLLRGEGVRVEESDGDYTQAVARGRAESDADDHSFFIDDERSEDLFFGYSTAALRVKIQLLKAGVTADKTHPLFLYLPCGVGGAPGGITFGFKELFGDAVHCFFAEPVEAPCYLLGMASGKHGDICVEDIGLTGRTALDGLAVTRPSGFVCAMTETLVSGAFTVTDAKAEMYRREVAETDGIRLEPSACAGFEGVRGIMAGDPAWNEYIERNGLSDYMDRAAHIVWGTGGGLMPMDS